MKENIDKKLKQKNVRPTAMRELVLDMLLEQSVALSLSEIEDKFDQADKSTLYRTLKTFEENKVIHSVDDGSGMIKYAVCKDTCSCDPSELHAHFHCVKCKKTYCLTDVPVPEVGLPHGFTIDYVNLVVKGVCVNCRK